MSPKSLVKSQVKSSFLDIYSVIRSIVAHQYCTLCQVNLIDEGDLCQLCIASLPYASNYCYVCGHGIHGQEFTVTCQSCRSNPPNYDRTLVLFHYDFPIDKWIYGLKFSNKIYYARLLGELFFLHISQKKISDMPQALLPMPLSLKRYFKRGYNQSRLIAKVLAKGFNLPILSDCIHREHRPEQAMLGREQRIQNLEGSMTLLKPIPYRHVAIIDDVKTTGASVKELSRVLRKWGVEKISVWVICGEASNEP